MAEVLTLTTPITPANRTTQRIVRMVLDWDAAAIRIDVVGSDGTVTNVSYDGPTATALMTTFNSANFSVNSLQKQALNKMVTDGKLTAGTVSGTPV